MDLFIFTYSNFVFFVVVKITTILMMLHKKNKFSQLHQVVWTNRNVVRGTHIQPLLLKNNKYIMKIIIINGKINYFINKMFIAHHGKLLNWSYI